MLNPMSAPSPETTPSSAAGFELQHDVPLAPLTGHRTGGAARWFCRVTTEPELVAALSWAEQQRCPVLFVGGGSNLLVSDAGFDGLALQIALLGTGGFEAPAADDAATRVVWGKAGEPWDDFVERTTTAGLAGLECLSGIPGTLGATPIQNVGAYGQEVRETLHTVRCLDRQSLRPRVFSNAECGFRYRHSRFKGEDRERYVVLEVSFSLRVNGTPTPRYPELERALSGLPHPTPASVRATVLGLRASKSMLADPRDPNGRSCGSFFLNPILPAAEFAALLERCPEGPPPHYPEPDGAFKVPAAWLIEHAGFARGHREGAVGLSTKHTLCVVAHDGATSSEILAFSRRIQARVRERFGVTLVPEPVFVGL